MALIAMGLMGCAGWWSFDPTSIEGEDREAMANFLETSVTDAENALPSGDGTMTITDTQTSPVVCRRFVVELSNGRSGEATGCRESDGAWELGGPASRAGVTVTASAPH